jgi:predicted deacetylase
MTKGWLVVSVHDVAPPQWDQVQRTLGALAAIGVTRRSLLVIPNFQGRWPLEAQPRFVEALRRLQAQGDEMVLHGYEHVGVGTPSGPVDRFRNRWFTQHEGEFLSLDYAEARRRLELGLAQTRRAGLDTRGFVAPAWLASPASIRAMRDCGFEHTNSYWHVSDLTAGRTHRAPSLVFGPGHLNEDVGIAAQRLLSRWLAHRRIVRVVLHPPCIDRPARFARILGMIRTQLAGHQPATYADLAGLLRTDLAAGADAHAH